jgi:hypothetical protein
MTHFDQVAGRDSLFLGLLQNIARAHRGASASEYQLRMITQKRLKQLAWLLGGKS